jgi:hypothetical protein
MKCRCPCTQPDECDYCIAVNALREINNIFKRKGHNDTCSYALGSEHACDCGAYIAERTLERMGEKP